MSHVILYGLSHPHANAHLKTLLLSDRVTKLDVYDPDAELVDRTVSEHDGVEAGYTDVEAAIEARPTGGVACFRNLENADLCVRLLEAGVHVISEKPIGATAAKVEAVVEAAGRNQLQLGVMYQNRSHPLNQEARRIVQAGTIGRVTGCEARLITSQVRFRNPDHWLFKKEVSGGGILSWLGCHYIDLLRYITGSEITAVSAMVDTLSGEQIDVEDVATMSFRFEGGFIGSMQAGYQMALSKSGYMGPNYETYMSIRGTDGRVVWEPSGSEHRLFVESTQWQDAPVREIQFSLPTVDAYGGAHGLAFLNQFLDAATGAAEGPVASGRDALHVARVIEGAYTSSTTGRHVEIAR